MSKLPRQPPVYRELPKRKYSFLRAFLIMVGAGLVAGLVVYGLMALHVADSFLSTEPVQQSQPQAKQPRVVRKTVVVNGKKDVPYPASKTKVAQLFGGDPSGWYRWHGGWAYEGDTPLKFTFEQNVTVYTDHGAFYWE